MFIAGVVIHVEPRSAQEAMAALKHRTGVTRIVGPVSPGRLAAAIEVSDETALDALMQGILATTGVTGVSPTSIYFNSQEESSVWS